MKNILFLLFFFNFSHAQFGSGDIKLENYNKMNLITNLSKSSEEKLDNSIEGSSLLFPESNAIDFVVTATDKNVFTIKSLNYDLNTNNLFMATGKDSIMEFKSSLVDNLVVDKKIYQFFVVNEVNKLSEVLYKSDNILFINSFYLGKTKEKIDPMTKLVTAKRKYFKEDRFYIKMGKNEFVEIKLKEKAILKLFIEKSVLIKEFINKNNLDCLNTEDVIKILTYYETL